MQVLRPLDGNAAAVLLKDIFLREIGTCFMEASVWQMPAGLSIKNPDFRYDVFSNAFKSLSRRGYRAI